MCIPFLKCLVLVCYIIGVLYKFMYVYVYIVCKYTRCVIYTLVFMIITTKIFC